MLRFLTGAALFSAALALVAVGCSDDPCGSRECGEVEGTICGVCSGATEVCSSDGVCVDACYGRECGESEGVDCGSCADGTQVCSTNGFCVGICQERECGQVGELSCGECTLPKTCTVDGRCVYPGCPSDMVEMGDLGVCIDALEYTVERFAAFLNEHGEDCSSGFESEMSSSDCGIREGYELVFQDGAWQPAAGKTDWPAPATWYGAVAACAWQGRRLCAQQEWLAACQGPNGWSYPYGPEYEICACHVWESSWPTTCPTDWGGDIVAVGSVPGCEGGYPGLLDMLGNASEWTSECELDTPFEGTRSCVVQGSQIWTQTCLDSGRSATHSGTVSGFRCCLDQE